MFSAGDDKQVKCWDLEQNKVRSPFHLLFWTEYFSSYWNSIKLQATKIHDIVFRLLGLIMVI